MLHPGFIMLYPFHVWVLRNCPSTQSVSNRGSETHESSLEYLNWGEPAAGKERVQEF